MNGFAGRRSGGRADDANSVEAVKHQLEQCDRKVEEHEIAIADHRHLLSHALRDRRRFRRRLRELRKRQADR